jgi:hypothetical protein
MRKKTLLVGTRKGLLLFTRTTSGWQCIKDAFLGIPVSMIYVDPLTGKWWVALDHGHWGMKLHYSLDEGNHWEEIQAPKYPEDAQVKEGITATLKYIWAISGGGDADPDTLYIGTEPGGLFQSDASGGFQFNQSLWDHPSRMDHWFGGGRDHAGIHSVVVDPRDPNHIYIGISVGGVFETKDGGQSWQGRNKGLRADFLPEPEAEFGHDPHLLVACQSNPDVMWQQNHCGIFRSTDGARVWKDVTDKDGGPANFGFAIAADHKNPLRAWVAPGISDVTRVAVDKALCICRTDNGGKTWFTFRKGLPQSYAFDIVYRHALIADDQDVLFGTTTGNLFYSCDAGESWLPVSNYLPMIYCMCWV